VFGRKDARALSRKKGICGATNFVFRKPLPSTPPLWPHRDSRPASAGTSGLVWPMRKPRNYGDNEPRAFVPLGNAIPYLDLAGYELDRAKPWTIEDGAIVWNVTRIFSPGADDCPFICGCSTTRSLRRALEAPTSRTYLWATRPRRSASGFRAGFSKAAITRPKFCRRCRTLGLRLATASPGRLWDSSSANSSIPSSP